MRKAAYALVTPACWRALTMGVAPAVEHRETLKGLNCDLIIDVGANRGQFSLMARLVHPDVPIVAFEPIPSEATVFRQIHQQSPQVTLESVALGEQPGQAEIHLSRRRDSSSLLPIGEAQSRMFPQTDEVGTLTVAVRRLDDFIPRWRQFQRILLKLDVQGFELSVLRGAAATLQHCAYVYAECSEVPLYVGQALRPEVESYLAKHGFVQHSRNNEAVSGGSLVQADYLYAGAGS